MSEAEVKYGLAGVLADDTSVSKVMPEINSLTYRGYKVQDLATQCRFEEVAYLIWNGELPTKTQLDAFNAAEKKERGLSENLYTVMRLSIRTRIRWTRCGRRCHSSDRKTRRRTSPRPRG
ncbi:MAG: hypothetical protein KAH44_20290 [Oricola sp.]|nr:hypothetical protein [Oricola sp.]